MVRPGSSAVASVDLVENYEGGLVLVYSAITSLDGYTTDAEGNFEWCAPDEEVLAFINDLERPIGTYLYGRLMYEVMHYWENVNLADQSAAARDFAGIWRSADKIVYSTSLPEAIHGQDENRATLRSGGRPRAEAAGRGQHRRPHPRRPRDQGRAGGRVPALRDAVHRGRRPRRPPLRERRAPLHLVEERRFASGVVYLRYRLRA